MTWWKQGVVYQIYPRSFQDNPHQPDSISVSEQQSEPDSLLNWYRQLIWLRKQTAALHSGDLMLLDSEPDILLYQRRLNHDVLLIVLNFSATTQPLPNVCQTATALKNTHHQNIPNQLQPYQGILMKQAQQ